MTETVKRRRRWPWVVLTTVLIAVAWPLAWRYRPLNAEEQRLVGTWRSLPAYDGAAIRTYQFTNSRRYSRYTESGFFEDSGTWQMSKGVVTFHRDRSIRSMVGDAIAACKAFVDPSTWQDVTVLWPIRVEFKKDDQVIFRTNSAGLEIVTHLNRDRKTAR